MANEKIVEKNGINICTENFGIKGNPVILLIAGATVSMLFWDEEFCQRLADNDFYVIRYDNRDVGKSTFYEPGVTPYDIVDLANDAINILDEYKIENAHFFGMSLGGMVSQIASIKYPQRVKTLALMSTMPWGDSDQIIPEMDSRILDFHARSETVNWSNEDNVVEYMLGGAAIMGGKKQSDKRRSEKLIRAEFKRANNYLSMFNHSKINGGEEYYNRLDEIKQRTLIIHGTDDLICHFGHANILLNKIGNSKLLTLENTGHELHFEDWDKILAGMTKHIIDHSAVETTLIPCT